MAHWIFLWFALSPGWKPAASTFPEFREQVIDPHVGEVCYALTLADVDGDKKNDIVAVTENRVVWFQNPTWEKRLITEDQTARDNVCIAPMDIDRDGKIDFALGAGWTKTGTLQWLSRNESLDQKWTVHPIGAEPWIHRIRWGDILGTGRPRLVVSPLNRTSGEGVRLLAFQIPAHPASEAWESTVLDATLNRMHNHWTIDFDANGTEDVVTASEEGIFFFTRNPENGWLKKKLGTGQVDPQTGKGGAGEVKIGRLAGNRKFIATIEPMHGTTVAVYTAPKSPGELWTRHVLDESLKEGHGVWTADLDRDGSDELIIGHRVKGDGPVAGPGIYIYDAQDAEGAQWAKHVLDDGGVAVEDLIAEDLNGDGWIDIVAGGRATHNVKLYINKGMRD